MSGVSFSLLSMTLVGQMGVSFTFTQAMIALKLRFLSDRLMQDRTAKANVICKILKKINLL